MLGRAKCKILKEIRRKIADENDIPYITSECTHQGDCSGTCPRCESELRYLERELERRQRLGKTVAVTALCAGLAIGASGCSENGKGSNVAANDPAAVEKLSNLFGHRAELAGMPEPVDPDGTDDPELAGDPIIVEPGGELEGDVPAPEQEAIPFVMASNYNPQTVEDGAKFYPLYTPRENIILVRVTTYHWNGGAGAQPGELRIYDETRGGELLGTWGGEDNSNGRNVDWAFEPMILLAADHSYRFVDSDAKTWSTNDQANGVGFIELYADENDADEVEGELSAGAAIG